MMKYLHLTIEELHRLLVDKKIKAIDLVEEAIDSIKSCPNLIMEADNFEAAKAQALAIEEVKEEEFLKGIPYLCKDNFSTEGIKTTASSNILEGYTPIFDAEIISRLKEAGAILLGKTTLDELAMGGTGTTGHKGITYNPYDEKRIIGGSSCGSAAAMAEGIVPFAIGSDTGDSVRKPASYGGLVGLKPSWGRISRFGLFSFATSLDTVAYFTRSVKDCAKILEVLAGEDKKDLSSSELPVPVYSKFQEAKGLKIGYFKEIIDGIEDEDIINSYNRLISSLSEQGYSVEAHHFPQELLNAIYPTYMVISCSEATSNNANLDGIRFGAKVEGAVDYEDYIMKVRTNGFSDMVKRRFVIGSFSLLAENQMELFKRAQKARRAIVDELNTFFDKFDILLLPASPTVAPCIDKISTSWSKEPDYLENYLGLANFSGTPSITVPLGIKGKLPYGVNITARRFEEDRLFSLSAKVEEIVGLKGLVKESE